MASPAPGLLLGPLLFSTEIMSREAVLCQDHAEAKAVHGVSMVLARPAPLHKQAQHHEGPRTSCTHTMQGTGARPSQTATAAGLSPGFCLPGHCFKETRPFF